ncbi:unnamed protein product [Hymenolepis diminuta]|uniref:Uncharacterized protein n=1 Tax=Hymenolepis diminuta TaxID=6216 RepID=A0A564Z8U5_HYMDI|nr:unnamed protein product [Hymenolepis diminuta]
MIEENDNITLEDLANKQRKLYIRLDSSRNQQKCGELDYVNGISTVTVSDNVFNLQKPLTGCWLCTNFHFARFFGTNLMFANFVTNEDIRKHCFVLYQISEREEYHPII